VRVLGLDCSRERACLQLGGECFFSLFSCVLSLEWLTCFVARRGSGIASCVGDCRENQAALGLGGAGPAMLPILTAVLCHRTVSAACWGYRVPHTTATSLWLENCAYVGDCGESLAVLWFHDASLAMFPILIRLFFSIGLLDFMLLIGLAWMGYGLIMLHFHSICSKYRICCEAEMGDFFSGGSVL
jgi:hypothetical protein